MTTTTNTPDTAANARQLWGRLQRLDVTKPPRPPDWLIEGLLDVADLSVIFGPFGSGKSFVALDLALSMATGEPALTMYPTGAPRTVLYIASEGLRNFENRARAWAWHRAKGNPARIAELQELVAANVRLWVALDADGRHRALPLNLANSEDPYFARLEGLALADVVEVVIVDVIADTAVGVDENSAAFGEVLRRLRSLPVPVIALHHAGKDTGKGMRGSSAAPAAADNVILATATVEEWAADGLNPKTVAIVLEDNPHRAPGTKRREGQHFGTIGLRLGAPDGLPHGDPASTPPATILGPSLAQSFRNAGHNLKPQEVEALQVLRGQPDGEANGPTMAEALGVTNVGPRIFKRLDNLGLVEVTPGRGRRAAIYRITPKGRAILKGNANAVEPDDDGPMTAESWAAFWSVIEAGPEALAAARLNGGGA